MSQDARFARLEDLLRLAVMMQGRAGGVTLAEMMTEFGVSRRTAERLRDALLRALPQIEEQRDGGGQKRWVLPGGTLKAVASVTAEELACLHRGAELAEKLGDAATAAQVRAVADKVQASLAPKLQNRIAPDLEVLLQSDGVALRPGPRESLNPELLATLREAILAGTWIESDHRARGSGKLSRNARLGPVALLLGERQYLLAFAAYQQDLRLYALSGFERVAKLNEPFTRPQGFDLQAYLARAFGSFQEAPSQIVWRFSPAAAAEARSFRFHPTQSFTEEPDGSLTLRFVSGGLLEMCWHLFRWGNQVEVLAPQKLQTLYTDLLRAALRE